MKLSKWMGMKWGSPIPKLFSGAEKVTDKVHDLLLHLSSGPVKQHHLR